MANPPLQAEFRLRSPSYRVARCYYPCWRCKSAARVYALALPEDHETLEADTAAITAGETTADCWQRAGFDAWIFGVDGLAEAVRRRLHFLAPGYRRAPEQSAEHDRWTNYCEHCGAEQSDDELHCEFGGAFMPMTADAAAQIELLTIEEPFAGSAGGYCCDPPLFASLRRI